MGCFNDIRLFVACFGMLLLTDIMAGVMKKSSLTTIERRFNLPSTTTALLASSFQIGSLTTVLFASYFGSRWHRPRTIFIGSIFLVLGNVIVTLPQFFGGRYEFQDIASNASSSTGTRITECGSHNDSSDMAEIHCDEENNPTNNLYIFLVVGMMINGVGGSALQPLGMSYIDDFAHKRNSPIYLGLTKAIALVGPMMGYVASSFVLKLWVDIGWVDISTINITPTHPSWVGAWWLGILICTSGIAITMIPFPYFPKKMQKQEYKGKSTDEHTDELDGKPSKRDKDYNETAQTGSALSREKKKFIATMTSLLKNHFFHLILLKMYLGNLALVGIANFFPKYLEVAFGVSASKASLLTGVINIPAVIVGTLIGAFTMKRCNVGTVGATRMIAVATFLASACIAPLLFIGCDTIDISGITTPYENGTYDNLPAVESACNANCGCDSGTYAPVCGSDGVSYISPCHAGCVGAEYDASGLTQNFTECSCIAATSRSVSWAKPERCQLSNCGDLVFVALAFKSAASLFAGIAATPMYIVMLRSVQVDQKSLAIGLYLVIIRVLGWIPGPIIYGAFIDSACLYWGMKPCSDRAYCKVYDNKAYRHRFYGMIVLFNILSCVVAIALYFVAKRVQKKEKSDSTDIPLKEENQNGVAAKDDADVEEKLM